VLSSQLWSLVLTRTYITTRMVDWVLRIVEAKVREETPWKGADDFEQSIECCEHPTPERNRLFGEFRQRLPHS